MAIEAVRDYMRQFHREQEILEFPASSATVELAAKAVGVIPDRIAKTLSFHGGNGRALLVVAAGDCKINNRKFKKTFNMKAKMLSPDEVQVLTGHEVGGVCPFANPEHVTTYLDVSMQRFPSVYPAAGSASSAIELTCEELFKYSQAKEWIDVCKAKDVQAI